MGSCVSKCITKNKQELQEHILIQDKLVITQPPKSPTIQNLIQNPVSPSPSPLSTSSCSSLSCTAGGTTSTCSLSTLTTASSCSSSILNTKDRSFSNEYLWSCIQENRQIVSHDQIKKSVENLVGRTSNTNFRAPIKQVIPDRRIGSIPLKRARDNSPNVVRQKSFRERKEIDRRQNSPVLTRQKSFRERPQSPHPMERTPGSSSPNRRFDGDYYGYNNGDIKNLTKEDFCKGNVSLMRREKNPRVASPNNNLSRYEGYLRSRERILNQNGKRGDEISVGEVRPMNKTFHTAVPMENIDNPLIALDCFIFL